MIATLCGMSLGLLFGLIAAGPMGGLFGIAIGAVLGLLAAGAPANVRKPAADAALVREDQHLLCIPNGQVATATFVRDAGTGQWLDVERCSLSPPGADLKCEKNCLVLIRGVKEQSKQPMPTRSAGAQQPPFS
jgi:hypothetical protein